jgi:hypothetical protein
MPLVDEAWTLVDMTFSTMRSMRISLEDLSTTLNSPDMHTRYQVSQVDEQTITVRERVAISQ